MSSLEINPQAGSSAIAVVPVFKGNYTQWRVAMQAYMMRAALDGSYDRPIPKWVELDALTKQWAVDEEQAAIDECLAKPDGAASSSSASAADSMKNKEQSRKKIRAIVERSQRAYGVLLQALPDDLRALIMNIPRGYAYGIWEFLERRYRNTDVDNVWELFGRWHELRMADNELFDQYKARVDQVYELLTHAKQQPTAEYYSYVLLEKLQPSYKQVVLALKAGSQLKQAEKINWKDIVSFVQQHERDEQRLGGAEAEAEQSFYVNGRRGTDREYVRNKAMSEIECVALLVVATCP